MLGKRAGSQFCYPSIVHERRREQTRRYRRARLRRSLCGTREGSCRPSRWGSGRPGVVNGRRLDERRGGVRTHSGLIARGGARPCPLPTGSSSGSRGTGARRATGQSPRTSGRYGAQASNCITLCQFTSFRRTRRGCLASRTSPSFARPAIGRSTGQSSCRMLRALLRHTFASDVGLGRASSIIAKARTDVPRNPAWTNSGGRCGGWNNSDPARSGYTGPTPHRGLLRPTESRLPTRRSTRKDVGD